MTYTEALGYVYETILEDLHYQKCSQLLKPFYKTLALLMCVICALPTVSAYIACSNFAKGKTLEDMVG